MGWRVFEPTTISQTQIFGLRLLAFVFPAIALSVIILTMLKYPLHGDRLKEVKDKLAQIHAEKKSKIGM